MTLPLGLDPEGFRIGNVGALELAGVGRCHTECAGTQWLFATTKSVQDTACWDTNCKRVTGHWKDGLGLSVESQWTWHAKCNGSSRVGCWDCRYAPGSSRVSLGMLQG